MSFHGILVIDLLGAVFALWVLDLVRTRRLHAGYAALWLAALAGALLLVTVEPLRAWITQAVGALFPASALALLAFAFIFVVLVLFSMRLSALSARQIELVQELALRDARNDAAGTPGTEGPGEPGNDVD